VTLAVLILLSISPLARAEGETCPAALSDFLKAQGYSEIELSQSTAKQFEVEATLNGSSPLLLILDTGASMTLFDRDKLEGLGLEFTKTDIDFTGIGGKQRLYSADIKNLEIGSASTGPMTILSADLSDFRKQQKSFGSRPADGLIGADFLSRYSAILEVKHSKLYLRTR
jgi:predicted aspartyl protease